MTDPPRTLAQEPAADVEITPRLARALLAAQHPDLADLPIRPAASGWDNEVFRLGEVLALRLPRRQSAAPLLLREQRFLPQIAAGLPLPAPIPVRVGRPASGYPYPWSVTPWFQGATADLAPPGAGQGPALAAFLKALHRPAPGDAPASPVRGGPLASRADAFENRLSNVERQAGPAPPHVRRLWSAALAAPIDTRAAWLHGDLHGRNVLVRRGRFVAVIDWGDLCGGDIACDLAALWMLLPDRSARAAAIAAYGASDATWVRARGWAVLMAMMLLAIDNNPRMPRMGAAILERLETGP